MIWILWLYIYKWIYIFYWSYMLLLLQSTIKHLLIQAISTYLFTASHCLLKLSIAITCSSTSGKLQEHLCCCDLPLLGARFGFSYYKLRRGGTDKQWDDGSCSSVEAIEIFVVQWWHLDSWSVWPGLEVSENLGCRGYEVSVVGGQQCFWEFLLATLGSGDSQRVGGDQQDLMCARYILALV